MTMLPAASSFWADRVKASGIHLGLSLLVASLAATLVFWVWYPYPYREISGGRELFLLVVTVDVILGPLITLSIFNRTKPWPVLRRDLAVVALLQLSALGYGMWTVFVARPVHLVFEYYRLAVVHAVDVPAELLAATPPSIDALPLTGPTLLSVRAFKSPDEQGSMTMQAIGGVSLAARPDLWQAYSAAIPQILKEAKPASQLKTRFPARAAEIDQALAPFGQAAQGMVYLPMVGRKSFWTAFLDPITAEVRAFLPLDSF
ncbi:MAG: TfpX/TfpZ family type IV pilin accessory protein [Rhodoferax sp.]